MEMSYHYAAFSVALPGKNPKRLFYYLSKFHVALQRGLKRSKQFFLAILHYPE